MAENEVEIMLPSVQQGEEMAMEVRREAGGREVEYCVWWDVRWHRVCKVEREVAEGVYVGSLCGVGLCVVSRNTLRTNVNPELLNGSS